MGQKTSRSQKPKKLIISYWKSHNKPSHQKKLNSIAHQLFQFYDKKKLGYLDPIETKEYLEDLFEAVDVRLELTEEAKSLGREVREYCSEIMDHLVLLMDHDNDGRIYENGLLKPDNQFLESLQAVKARIRESQNQQALGNSIINPNGARSGSASLLRNQQTRPHGGSSHSLMQTVVVTTTTTNNGATPQNALGSNGNNNEQIGVENDVKEANDNDGAFRRLSSHDSTVKLKEREKDKKEITVKKNKEAEEEGEMKEKEGQWGISSTNTTTTSNKPSTQPFRRFVLPQEEEGEGEEEEEQDHEEIEGLDGEEEDNESFGGDLYDSFNGENGTHHLSQDLSSKGKERKDKESAYEVLAVDKIQMLMEEIVDRVCPLLCLSRSNAALVLQIFNWDESVLNKQYYENIEKYLAQAGVVLEPGAKPSSHSDVVVCQVCTEEVPITNTFELECGHRYYCRTCWRTYLEEVIKRGAVHIMNAHCMANKCRIRLNNDAWLELASSKEYQRYRYFYIKTFVDGNKKMKYCPNPSCGNILRYKGFGKAKQVAECSCGFKFCFSCCMENHNPVTCEEVTTWRDRNQDEEASMKLLLATAKQCPHCGVFTQRTDGCNHMTCRKEHGGCGGEWCWMCRGDWKSHGAHTGGYYSCNKYESSDQKRIDDKSQKMALEAERYSHFWERYANHNRLKTDAQKAKEKIVEKGLKYRQETGLDPTFLLEALDLLIECRQKLKYTYVYGYFLDQKHSNRKDLFEHQQANLEGITERLADLLFAPLDRLDSQHLKHLTRVTTKYLTNLVKSFEEQQPV